MITNWNEVTLQQYTQIYNIIIDESLSEEEKLLCIVQELYTDIDIFNSKFGEVSDFFSSTAKLITSDIPSSIVQDTYTINGTEYVLTKDISNITTSQYMDYMHYMNGEVKNVNTYHDFLCIFLIPKDHKYNDGYNMAQVRKDILSMSITDILGIADFFLVYYNKSLKVFQKYLVWEVLKAKGITIKEKMKMIKKIVGDYSH